MRGSRLILPAAVACSVLAGTTACASGPSSKGDVCAAYDNLGDSVNAVNGVYDNPVFRRAGDLGDLAARYPGRDLSSNAAALHRIADKDSTSVLELAQATDDIAGMCADSLQSASGYGGTNGGGTDGSTDGGGGTYGGGGGTDGTAGDGSGSTQDPTTELQTEQSTTEPTAVDTNPAYQRLIGPGGITVDVPASWHDNGSSTSYRQVGDSDPAGAFARFGGYPPTGATVLAEITAGERTNPNIRTGYQRISLSATTFQGSTAVEWEFRFVKAGVTRHVHAVYWRTGGTEYLIYLSGPEPEWSALTPVFDVMRDSVATP